MRSLAKLDLRSLALTRFLLGLLAFIDILNRFSQIDDFYSDKGIIPRWLLLQSFEIKWRMSLLLLNGSTVFAWALGIVGLIAALFYCFGMRTRFSNIVVWIVLMSFHARFPEVNHGGDNLLRLMLFWSIFLPM